MNQAEIEELILHQRCVEKDASNFVLVCFLACIHVLFEAFSLILSLHVLTAAFRLREMGYAVITRWLSFCCLVGISQSACNLTFQAISYGEVFKFSSIKNSTEQMLRYADNFVVYTRCLRNWAYVVFASNEAIMAQPQITFNIGTLRSTFVFQIMSLMGFAFLVVWGPIKPLRFNDCSAETEFHLRLLVPDHTSESNTFELLFVHTVPAVAFTLIKFSMLSAVFQHGICDVGIEKRLSFLATQRRLTSFIFGALLTFGVTEYFVGQAAMQDFAFHQWTWHAVSAIYDCIIHVGFVALYMAEESLNRTLGLLDRLTSSKRYEICRPLDFCTGRLLCPISTNAEPQMVIYRTMQTNRQPRLRARHYSLVINK
ncbi:unnamed protein product [Dibothriocephalus latus]|uniref:Uncharacterized protein n=1 Tax=Dibothriocephalus latus TaxID=60516 RepID=A0A3P7NNK6_DIBLA|nr:unnamed protein product [Dibothriocephalus latus]